MRGFINKKFLLTVAASVIFGIIIGLGIPYLLLSATDIDREIIVDADESKIQSVQKSGKGYIVEYSLFRAHHIKASCDEVSFFASFDDGSSFQSIKVYSADALTDIGPLSVSFYVDGIDEKKLKEHIPVIYAEAKTNEKYIIKFEN